MDKRWPICFVSGANYNQFTGNSCLECYIKELRLGMAQKLSAVGVLLGAASWYLFANSGLNYVVRYLTYGLVTRVNLKG